MIIAISGPPGSGKSTVAKLFAEKFGWDYVSAGEVFRREAESRGMSLKQFTQYASENFDVDRRLDDRVGREVAKLLAQGRNVVVDGHIQAFLLPMKHDDCFTVWIDAPLDVRVERLAGRESKSPEEARKEIELRHRSEKERYSAIYQINLTKHDDFDLVIDSSVSSPEEIVNLIRERVSG